MIHLIRFAHSVFDRLAHVVGVQARIDWSISRSAEGGQGDKRGLIVLGEPIEDGDEDDE